MATLNDLLTALKRAKPESLVGIYTPSGVSVPCHFHITEIGQTIKNFVDCGGVKRQTTNTTFQVWVADDYDHKLTVEKLTKIINAGHDLINPEDEIVVEFDNKYTIGLYGVESTQILDEFVNIYLSKIKANCLAPDKCGIKPKTVTCCGSKGCC